MIDMTIDESIKEEQTLYDIAKDKYEKLGIKNCLKRMEEHKQYIEWLEELKSIREMDLSIPQHFTKEQSDWIKAYCIQRNKEFYNKAIDDFAEKIIDCIDGEFMYQFKYFPATTMRGIAEQLKKGELDDKRFQESI